MPRYKIVQRETQVIKVIYTVQAKDTQEALDKLAIGDIEEREERPEVSTIHVRPEEVTLIKDSYGPTEKKSFKDFK
mgnify:CR=1|jgi:hypothetical protein